MRSKYAHLSDEELPMFADGELSRRRVSQVNAHLAACWDCRIRIRQLEEAISDFVWLHYSTLDPQLTPATGPRALLKARLTEAAATVRHSRWLQLFQRASGQGLAYFGAMVLTVALGMIVAHHSVCSPVSTPVPWTIGPVPAPRLTPGVARSLSTSEVCTIRYSDDTRLVPASVRERIYQEYGIAGAEARDYELDYLISPQLGGTDDNLWPEPALPDRLEHAR